MKNVDFELKPLSYPRPSIVKFLSITINCLAFSTLYSLISVENDLPNTSFTYCDKMCLEMFSSFEAISNEKSGLR